LSKLSANESIKDVVIESIILNTIATQNPSTLNPLLSRLDAINMMAAFITRRNNPSVTTVIGKVRKIKIGFTKIFMMIKIKDTNIAIDILSTCTPGINDEIKNIAKAVDINFARNFILYC
jgi:hypothetical protein